MFKNAERTGLIVNPALIPIRLQNFKNQRNETYVLNFMTGFHKIVILNFNSTNIQNKF